MDISHRLHSQNYFDNFTHAVAMTAVRYAFRTRAPDKMRICVFHSNLNVKNSIIFGNVRIMYAKHFPDTQLCPVSKRICFVYILMECGLLPIFP